MKELMEPAVKNREVGRIPMIVYVTLLLPVFSSATALAITGMIRRLLVVASSY